jgi:glycerol-3-phosphate acyltransferase PlsX
MNVAVDAMGGDNAPMMVVQGAVQAASELGIKVTLVGDKDLIADAIDAHVNRDLVTVHHCEEVVLMHEPPLKAVRKKKDSSIRVAFDLVKREEADAVVSAGNSGATLAAGVLTLGRLEGVERPAIAGIFPGEKGNVVLIDMGANVDCRPNYLFQFGIMGHAFASSCLGMENPKIGLLSIGEEGSKGNEQVRQTHQLFNQSELNFQGNVEGRDLFSGEVQIIVCDGFVGNVALKLTEGMAEAVTNMLKIELNRSFLGRAAFFLGSRSIRTLKRKLDYEMYGGAPLLGINGVGIICHGGSSATAIRNAVVTAARYVKNRVLQKMAGELSAMASQKALVP